MKITVEFRSDMSRKDLAQALRICLEAAHRLAERMTPAQLEELRDQGIALATVAEATRRNRQQQDNFRRLAAPSEGRA